MMNRKAAEIGLHDTYFITPNGLDAEDAGGVHHTTARDLAQLMRYCVTQSEQKEAFQAICQTRQYTFASCDGTRQFTVYNKNALLDRMDGVLAGKTGFTGNAGYCYVAAVNVGEKHFIVALLACGWPHNRHYKWADTRVLLAYGDANYEYQEIKLAGVQIPAIPVADGLEPTISGTCEGKFTVLLSDSETVQQRFVPESGLTAPVARGDMVGTLQVSIGDTQLAGYPVYAAETVDKKNFSYYIGTVFDAFFY